ncbi:MAG: hypothetical protein K5979_10905 [Ruminococcus sp.]|nr:hypothetical protein [Ruminococcus sp.]
MKFVLQKNEIQKVLDKIAKKLKDEGTNGFSLIKNRKNEEKDLKFTNVYCLNTLEYDDEDVMNEILNLKVTDYYENVFDRNGEKPDVLHIFIKEIINKQVYIKLKIKEIGERDIVLCISFHFAEHYISKLPYG